MSRFGSCAERLLKREHPESPLMRVWARAVRGAEWVAAAELRSKLGATDIVYGHRDVLSTLPSVSQDIAALRSIDDLFLLVAELGGLDHTRANLPLISKAVGGIDLDSIARVIGQLRPVPSQEFDVVASFLGKRNYNRFDIEDAVGVAISQSMGGRWVYLRRREGETTRALPLSLRIHIHGDEALIGVRLAREPLHKRTYKVADHLGTLYPPLAAALAIVSGLRAGRTLLDPFCGAGTIAIEAGRVVDGLDIYAHDIDPAAVALTVENAERAGIRLTARIADAGGPMTMAADRVVTNPPWGRAVLSRGQFRGGARALLNIIAAALRPSGRAVVLIPDEPDLPSIAKAAGLSIPLDVTMSLFGSHPHLVVLAHREGDHAAIDMSGAYGAELSAEWDRFSEASMMAKKLPARRTAERRGSPPATRPTRLERGNARAPAARERRR
jgi:tRNA (guanine6-N2)-methyltransferase